MILASKGRRASQAPREKRAIPEALARRVTRVPRVTMVTPHTKSPLTVGSMAPKRNGLPHSWVSKVRRATLALRVSPDLRVSKAPRAKSAPKDQRATPALREYRARSALTVLLAPRVTREKRVIPATV